VAIAQAALPTLASGKAKREQRPAVRRVHAVVDAGHDTWHAARRYHRNADRAATGVDEGGPARVAVAGAREVPREVLVEVDLVGVERVESRDRTLADSVEREGVAACTGAVLRRAVAVIQVGTAVGG